MKIAKFIIYTKNLKINMLASIVMEARILIIALRLNTNDIPYPICNLFSTSLPIECGLAFQSCEGLL